MLSLAYRDLQKRVEELRAHFIAFTVPPDRSPEPKEIDCIAAFRLLAHAEIEWYIEERTRSSILVAGEIWRNSKVITRSLLNLLQIFPPIAWDIKQQGLDVTDIDSTLEMCQRKAMDAIANNHGIREASFRILASFCGCLSGDIDQTLVNTMNTYGHLRGELAHKRTDRVPQIPSPEDEYASATAIISGLEQFDLAVERITGNPLLCSSDTCSCDSRADIR